MKPESGEQRIGPELQTKHLEIVLELGIETKRSGSVETMDQ